MMKGDAEGGPLNPLPEGGDRPPRPADLPAEAIPIILPEATPVIPVSSVIQGGSSPAGPEGPGMVVDVASQAAAAAAPGAGNGCI
jgi:hypothetical protein